MNSRQRRWAGLAASATLLLAMQVPAYADDLDRRDGHDRRDEPDRRDERDRRDGRDRRGLHDQRDERREGPREWHGDIHAFHEHDLDRWRGGSWFHGPHQGRRGWWWIVAGVWYFYPEAVYPYPDPYQPPVVVLPPEPTQPPHYLYYCNDPAGYYPYVARCLTPWQRVLSEPQAPPEGLPPPQ